MKSSKLLINKINKVLNLKGIGFTKVDSNNVSVGIVDLNLINDKDTVFAVYCIRKNMENKRHLKDVSIIYYNNN
jgi:hypothetical protein